MSRQNRVYRTSVEKYITKVDRLTQETALLWRIIHTATLNLRYFVGNH